MVSLQFNPNFQLLATRRFIKLQSYLVDALSFRLRITSPNFLSLTKNYRLMLCSYAEVGWKELVNIQAPKDRLWARNEVALDLLSKCLEV